MASEEETERMKRNMEKCLEPKIKPLVIELNRLGIKTSQSCQGHNDRGDPYPWVNFQKEEWGKVLKIVQWYNTKGRGILFWEILPIAFIRIKPTRKNNTDKPFTLEELQESALHFAKKISELKEIPEIDMSLRVASL